MTRGKATEAVSVGSVGGFNSAVITGTGKTAKTAPVALSTVR